MNATKRVLVVYYSLTGNTARVAKDLATRLDADVESIQDKGHGVGFLGQLTAAFDAWRKAAATIGPIQCNPSQYEITLIGTPVWVGQMTPAIRAYLQATDGRFQNVAFFITSGDTEVEKIFSSLEALAKCKPVASTGFNARELINTAAYEAKVASFVEAIKRVRAPANAMQR